MTPELAYFLKVNVAIAFFYAFYRLFFYKDTFFRLRRSLLLAFFGIAYLYPLLNIQEWIKEQEPIAEVVVLYSTMLPEVSIEAAPAMATNWTGIFVALAFYTYIAGAVVLAGRFVLQFGSILSLARKCRKVTMDGTKVHLLDKPSGPFSFFHMIFIYPANHTTKELGEILTHEKTHARQYHSIDVIVCEILSIVCWVNPFVWLLKREVRHNLEYLADNVVIQSGYDSKSYQYHLLGLAHHQGMTDLYNSFNVLHLKNRISMMNKKRSRGIVRTKYLMFIPLAAVLMLLSNIEAVARITKSITTEVVAAENIRISGVVTDTNKEPIIGAAVIIKGSTTGTVTDIDGGFQLEASADAIISVVFMGMKSVDVAAKDYVNGGNIVLKDGPSGAASMQAKNASSPQGGPVYKEVEDMPKYPGGEMAMLRFISKNVKYPVEAQEAGAQGKVVCSMVINEQGKVTDVKVEVGVHPALDAEAVRVLKTMPAWTPGRQDGKKVKVAFVLPVLFRLSGPASAPKKQTSAKTDGPFDMVFSIVEDMPKYPGDDRALMEYIQSHIQYPLIAKENGIEGRVVCSFVIDKDGSVTNPTISRGVDPALDKEALRVVGTIPKWTPGMQQGRAVKVRFTVPVLFSLKEAKGEKTAQ